MAIGKSNSVSSKNNIMQFLTKTASAVMFQSPFSPNRDATQRSKLCARRGYSGPIAPMIPSEVRRKRGSDGFEKQDEPTSPKVSCTGQIKLKKKMSNTANPTHRRKDDAVGSPGRKNYGFRIWAMFGRRRQEKKKRSGYSSRDPLHGKPQGLDKAPSLSQMKRFSSGRDAWAMFDYAVESPGHCSDHENGPRDDEEEEEDIVIPYSAPITARDWADLKRRKEVALWQRRSMRRRAGSL